MPLTDAFLATCRTAVEALPELATFRAAKAVADTATRAARVAAWHSAYDGVTSPAYLLRRAIRDTVNAQADIAGNKTLLDRESAYGTLSAQYAHQPDCPLTDAQEQAELERLILLDQAS